EGPVEGELAVVLVDIARPKLVALVVKRAQRAVAKEEDDAVGVRGGRGRGEVAAFVAPDGSAFGLLVPEDLAGGAVKAHYAQGIRGRVRRGDKNEVADDDGGGRA